MTIGNPDNLPIDPEYLIGRPAKLRVFHEPSTYECYWVVDGCAVVNGKFAYTEKVWTYDTWQEAIAALPDFWIEVR